MAEISIRRLGPADRELAGRMFRVMADVFEEPCAALGDAYLDALLRRADFWALAAHEGDEILGGVTAHALPSTRREASELFIYDIAVRPEHQRRGVGRALMEALQSAAAAAGIRTSWVPADDEDTHALAFYRALGGEAAPVTHFTFSAEDLDE